MTRLVIITCGGDRKRFIEQQFHHVDGFQILFSPGVAGNRLVVEKDYFEKSASSLLQSSQKYSDCGEGWDVEEAWSFVRDLDREQRGVLGNFLAHINAMELAVEEGYDIVLEDGVRCDLEAGIHAEALRNQILLEPDLSRPHFLYTGYLGSQSHLEYVYSKYLSEVECPDLWFPLPVGKDPETGKKFDLIWGSFSYMSSKAAFLCLLTALRQDLGKVFWRLRSKAAVVKPIDKVIPRILLSSGMNVMVAHRPIFFRSPGVRSQIHKRYDAAFRASTTLQLARTPPGEGQGRSWRNVWLTPAERALVEGGRGDEGGGDDRGARQLAGRHGLPPCPRSPQVSCPLPVNRADTGLEALLQATAITEITDEHLECLEHESTATPQDPSMQAKKKRKEKDFDAVVHFKLDVSPENLALKEAQQISMRPDGNDNDGDFTVQRNHSLKPGKEIYPEGSNNTSSSTILLSPHDAICRVKYFLENSRTLPFTAQVEPLEEESDKLASAPAKHQGAPCGLLVTTAEFGMTVRAYLEGKNPEQAVAGGQAAAARGLPRIIRGGEKKKKKKKKTGGNGGGGIGGEEEEGHGVGHGGGSAGGGPPRRLVVTCELLAPEEVIGPARSAFRRVVDNVPGEVARTNGKWRRILRHRGRRRRPPRGEEEEEEGGEEGGGGGRGVVVGEELEERLQRPSAAEEEKSEADLSH